MKLRSVSILIISLSLSLLLLCSCSAPSASSASSQTGSSAYAELERQLLDLKQSHTLANEENNKKISELSALLEQLQKEDSPSDSSGAEAPTVSEVIRGFKYIVSGSVATITGYTGNEKELVIPASVDGYRISSIADGAFEGSAIASVVISDGIESIGWFAFKDCSSLSSVTIPSSVQSIGYSAFGEVSDEIVLYCHADSFALSYAKSYGLAYTVI